MKKLEYSDSFNPIDRKLAERFEDSFPNYPLYWTEFFVPLTDYPSNKNFKNDTHPLLEGTGMASFGMVKSINAIISMYEDKKIGVGEHYQSFKNVYFHFGLIGECVDRLVFNIIELQKLLKIKERESDISKLVKEKYNKYKESIDSNIEQYKKTGKPITLYLYPPKDHLIELLDKQKAKGYNNFIRSIREYRNIFIHNPSVDVFTDNGKRYVVKKEKRNESFIWSNIRKSFDIHPEWFIDPYQMINDDINLMFTELNLLWPHLINELEKIWCNDKFGELYQFYKRTETTKNDTISSNPSTSTYPTELNSFN